MRKNHDGTMAMLIKKNRLTAVTSVLTSDQGKCFKFFWEKYPQMKIETKNR